MRESCIALQAFDRDVALHRHAALVLAVKVDLPCTFKRGRCDRLAQLNHLLKVHRPPLSAQTRLLGYQQSRLDMSLGALIERISRDAHEEVRDMRAAIRGDLQVRWRRARKPLDSDP